LQNVEKQEEGKRKKEVLDSTRDVTIPSSVPDATRNNRSDADSPVRVGLFRGCLAHRMLGIRI